MDNFVFMPTVANDRNSFEYAEYEEIVEQPVTKSCVSFLDANTNEISIS